jgi:endonuclease/exonuclease/phosphatase family metal-dependent hydrolase
MPNTPLSLVSLNIESSRHLDLVIPFLIDRQPDVACLQEVMAADLPRLTAETGMQAAFASMRYITGQDGPDAPQLGVAILSKHRPDSSDYSYYGNFHDTDYYRANPDKRHTHTVLLKARFGPYTIATTHFTWTPDGEASKEQRMNLERLICSLGPDREFVLCGDFNAPRGKEIFAGLAERFTDNIPADVISSIDGNLHRAGPLPLMVDGLFSTPGYSVSDVRVLNGVSDHCAILGTLQTLD